MLSTPLEKRDATNLDCVLMASVLNQAGRSPTFQPRELKESIGAYALVLDSGEAVGKISARIVRAMWGALESYTPQLRIDHLDNPFQSPHNLSWYFGSCACPMDVRQFATRIANSHVRVWSVAQSSDGWKVLAQVFGASSGEEAVDFLYHEAEVPAKSLKKHDLGQVSPYPSSLILANSLATARGRMPKKDLGVEHWVEVTLPRRFF